MVNDQIRLGNLLLLIAEAGSIAKVASRSDTSAAYLSQIINKAPSSTGNARGIGDKLARKLELGMKKPVGWIDVYHGDEYEKNNVKIESAVKQNESIYADVVTITKYDDVGASMGKGIMLNDQPGQITNFTVTNEWVNKNVPSNTGKNNLRVVTGFGDSMKGMFNPGDPLLIDIGVNKCDHDGVFFFSVGDEGFVKRLQRIPNVGIKAISKNPEYETWVITQDMDFRVLGKVLKVWKSDNF
jgi:phage repressor protein C with HTH and peptisase S24 domain